MDDLDWKYWLTFLINIVGLWLMWRADRKQARYMNPQAVENAFAALPWYAALRKRYWPIFVMLLLMIGSWMPYIFSSKCPLPTIGPIVKMFGILGPVGAPWPQTGVPSRLFLTLDGRLIHCYDKKYHAAGVAFHLMSGDVQDVQQLQKSAIYDIHDGDIQTLVPLDDKFMAEYEKNYRVTQYVGLLVPNNVRMEDFQTLREASRLGVIQLGMGSGPP